MTAIHLCYTMKDPMNYYNPEYSIDFGYFVNRELAEKVAAKFAQEVMERGEKAKAESDLAYRDWKYCYNIKEDGTLPFYYGTLHIKEE